MGHQYGKLISHNAGQPQDTHRPLVGKKKQNHEVTHLDAVTQ
jgi:hypothetical protein